MSIAPQIADFLHSYFDKIFVVSLPRFTERHKQIEHHLQGLNFEFFWGEDKQLLDFENLKNSGVYDDAATRKGTRHGKPMNLGEITCSLSHRKLYNAMLQNGWQRVIVFEDDILPQYDHLDLLRQALKELPEDWELLYLGYLKHEKVTASLKIKQVFYKVVSALGLMQWSYTVAANFLPKPYSKHLKRAGMHDCTHAYAITLSAAGKLSDAQTPVAYRADDLLSTLATKKIVNAFITEPKFFDQEWFHNPDAVSVKTV